MDGKTITTSWTFWFNHIFALLALVLTVLASSTEFSELVQDYPRASLWLAVAVALTSAIGNYILRLKTDEPINTPIARWFR